jgi:peptide/nickel transport system permease protein
VQKYIVQRLILTLPTLVLVTILTFVGLRVLLPADVIDLIIGEYGRNDPGLRKTLEKELGLSNSIPRQYANWVGLTWFTTFDTKDKGILQGNLGKSLHSGRPVLSELKRRVPVSFELGLWGQATAIAVAVPLGVWAALKQDRLPDYGFRSIAILLNAVPGFWIAVLVITFGSIWFNWAPPITFRYIYEDPIAHLKIMMLPALIIGLTPSGGLLRLVRTQMLEVLRQDYIRTAHAKGLSQSTVLYKHALRNALIPVVTVIGVGLPNIIAGTVIFEQIFIIPGMGRYLVDAVNNLDYPVIQGLNLVFAGLLMFSVLMVDISYAFLDPRIRFR